MTREIKINSNNMASEMTINPRILDDIKQDDLKEDIIILQDTNDEETGNISMDVRSMDIISTDDTI